MATKRLGLNHAVSADVNSGPTKLASGRATQTPAAGENAGLKPGRFQPGQSGNPAGRPRGSKSKLSEDFWGDMHDAWQEGGQDAIKAMMREEPGRFVDCVARALPKDVNVKHESTDAFVQLWTLISDGQAEAALEKVRQVETPSDDSIH